MNRIRKFLEPRKKDKPQKFGQYLLQSPDGRDLIAEAEYLNAKQILGIDVYEGPHHSAKVVGSEVRKIPGLPLYLSDRIQRAVVVHQKPFNPLRMFKWTSSFSLLIRSVEKNFNPHVSLLEEAKSKGNKAYRDYLDLVLEHTRPEKFPVYGRDAVVWAPADAIVPKGIEDTASLDGTIVTYQRIGKVIHSVLNRTAMDMQWYRLHPLSLPSPGEPWPLWFESPHASYVIGNRAYAFWTGVPDYYRLDELLALDIDIYMHIELDKNKLIWAKLIVRGESKYEEGKSPDFSTLEEQVKKTGGSWYRVSGMGVKEAFRFFIPGSSPPPSNIVKDLVGEDWKRHSLPKLSVKKHNVPTPGDVLPYLTDRISYSDDLGGNLMVGKLTHVHGFRTEHSFFLRKDIRPSQLFVAQSNTGKTTLANYIALQITPHVLSIQLSPTDEEAVFRFADEFGLKPEVIHLPDVTEFDQEENVRQVLQLIQEDTRKTQEELAQELAKWQEQGHPDLPKVLFTNTASVRYYNKTLGYLHGFFTNWHTWQKEHGGICVMIIDDFSGLYELTDDNPYLGNIPKSVRTAYRNFIKWSLDNCRKFGIMVFGTAHTKEEVAHDFPPGTLSSFTTVFDLEVGGKFIVNVINPARDEIIVKELSTRLPARIVKTVGR